MQKYAQQLQKAYCLANIAISLACSSPLFNAFHMWEILQNVELLCKHAHNKWLMGSEVFPSLLWSFHFIKINIGKHLSSSTLPAIYTMMNSTNFTYSRKLQMLSPNITLSWSKDWCQKVESCTLLNLTQLEHALLAIKVTNIQNLKHKGLHLIHQLGKSP